MVEEALCHPCFRCFFVVDVCSGSFFEFDIDGWSRDVSFVLGLCVRVCWRCAEGHCYGAERHEFFEVHR